MRTGTGFRNVTGTTSFDRLDRLSVSPRVVPVEILPVPSLLGIDDLWELICLEFLVLGRMHIIVSPLLEGQVLAHVLDQPCILLIKIIDYLEKI